MPISTTIEEECQHNPFLHALFLVLEEVWQINHNLGDDLVLLVQSFLSEKYPQLIDNGQMQVSYSKIVLGIYSLLTRVYITEHNRHVMIQMLEHCSGHDFTRFVRLTNSEYSPHFTVRRWAMSVLVDISKGERKSPGLVNDGKGWLFGANLRVRQLEKSGELIKHQIYPEVEEE